MKLVLFGVNVSFKKELWIICGVLLFLLSMPIIALGAATNLVVLANPAANGGATLYTGPGDTNDLYAWGNCTYWVFLLRKQAGNPIPNTWGNAATWAERAALDGYLVDHNPTAGSIMQISDVDNGLGHVAYVESVNPTDGSWTISEMNVKGLDIVDTKTLPASAAQGYNFIH
jgi:surface antigen